MPEPTPDDAVVPGGMPRPLVVVVVVLGALLVAGILVIRFVGSGTGATPLDAGPVRITPVDAPRASSAECSRLITALPTTLVDGTANLARRAVAPPAPPATAIWGMGNNPVVLRCGLPRPDQLAPTATLLEISGVQWLRVTGDGKSTWYAVDRPVYVALTLPDGSGSGPLQGVSAAVGRTLPPVPVNPAGR